MSALICDRCSTEIYPGSNVEMIGGDPDARIVLEDEMLIVHADCGQCPRCDLRFEVDGPAGTEELQRHLALDH